MVIIRRGDDLSFRARGMAKITGGIDLSFKLIHGSRAREVWVSIPKARVKFMH